MSNVAVLNFEELLAPISELHPTGEDQREDPELLYRDLKDRAVEARRLEKPKPIPPKGEKQERAAKPDWKFIVELAQKILKERSKDLEVTTLLIEALLRTNGFAGLRDGFSLARQLIDKYWDDLYPKPDEDGLATKVFGFTGLNGQERDGVLIAPIRRMELTKGSSVDPVEFWQYENYQKTQDPALLQTIEQAVGETDAEFFASLREDLDQCRDEYSGLCGVLKEKCEKVAPPSSNIKDALDAFRKALRTLSKEASEPEEGNEDNEDNEGNSDHIETTDAGISRNNFKLQSREEAFRTLEGVADYFFRKEPHSPVSYLLKQAVRWGRMPLPELMEELIGDEKVRETYSKLTGVGTSSK